MIVPPAATISASRSIGNDGTFTNLAGIVLISDGAATGGFDEDSGDGAVRDFLRSLDTRVHTVWAARPGLRDVAVAKVHADDSAFVRTVVEEVGMASFNRVWTSPNTLPNRAEIADPALWMKRVLRTSKNSGPAAEPAGDTDAGPATD